ncbi:MAG TPA: cupin domain-containing protein [Caulobacteraceae bacterium]|nr:cupin domain-containing protein [Caulobacteraceae bacterium]
MSEARYNISKDILFTPLQRIDVGAVAGAQTPWWNRTLTQVNDAVVRLAVMEGDFHWHKHDREDEFFYVLEGALTIEIDGAEPVTLRPGEGVTVPAGRPHFPRADGRTVVLMVEQASVTPTGD